MIELKIRKEKETDYDNVYKFVETAFKTANVSGGKEKEMMKNIHNSDRYISELTLIVENDEQIIGYIMLSKTVVIDDDKIFNGLLLGPVCTEVDLRNQGIGSQLIKEAINIAKKMNYTTIFLAGDCNYYSRFGFVPTSQHDIKCQYNIPEELLDNIMVLEIVPNALKGIKGIKGIVNL